MGECDETVPDARAYHSGRGAVGLGLTFTTGLQFRLETSRLTEDTVAEVSGQEQKMILITHHAMLNGPPISQAHHLKCTLSVFNESSNLLLLKGRPLE